MSGKPVLQIGGVADVVLAVLQPKDINVAQDTLRGFFLRSDRSI